MPSFRFLYALLGGSLVLSWAIPPAALLQIPLTPRLLAAAILTFSPVFIANLTFAQRFKDVASSTAAFGANLLGAMIGGVLEYTSILLGYHNLVILVGVFYAISFVLLRRIDSLRQIVYE